MKNANAETSGEPHPLDVAFSFFDFYAKITTDVRNKSTGTV